MNPHQLVGLTGPTNNFAMGGMNTHAFHKCVNIRRKTCPTNPLFGHYGQKDPTPH